MKSFSGIRKFCLALLALVLLSTAFVASGCNTTNNGQIEEVSSLDLSIRVVRIGIGLEILLIPRSDDGFLVEIDGSIVAKLWPQYSPGGKAEISNLFIPEVTKR